MGQTRYHAQAHSCLPACISPPSSPAKQRSSRLSGQPSRGPTTSALLGPRQCPKSRPSQGKGSHPSHPPPAPPGCCLLPFTAPTLQRPSPNLTKQLTNYGLELTVLSELLRMHSPLRWEAEPTPTVCFLPLIQQKSVSSNPVPGPLPGSGDTAADKELSASRGEDHIKGASEHRVKRKRKGWGQGTVWS